MSLILDGTTGVPVTTVTGTLPVANGGTGVTTSTGSGAVVLGTSPTLTTPVINGFTGDTSVINIGSGQVYKDASGNLLVGTTSQLGAAKQTIFAGNINATTYTTLGTTGGSNLYVQQQQTTSVTTSAVVMLNPSKYGSLCLVYGSDGTNRFQDLIMVGLGTGTINVITSLALSGTPASRTYSQSSSTYKVAMGSGTYTVQVSALSMND